MSRLSRLEVQIENIEKSLDVVQAETKANNQLCNELNKMVIELKISNENTTKMIEEVKEEGKTKGFYLSAYSITHKEKKAKGEVIDECFVVKIVKTYSPIWDI